MKKKIGKIILVVFILFILSLFIPIKKESIWVNDSDINDVGHYKTCYCNLYGGKVFCK